MFWAVFFPVLLTTALGIAFGGSVGPGPADRHVVARSRTGPRSGARRVGAARRRSGRARRLAEWPGGPVGAAGRRRRHRLPVRRHQSRGPLRAAAGRPGRAAGRGTRRSDTGPRRIRPGAGQPIRGLRGARAGWARHHEQCALGTRVLDRRLAQAEAHEAPGRDADVEDRLSAVVPGLADDDSRRRGRRADRCSA